MYSLFVSWMRSVVPVAAGWLLTLAGWTGVETDGVATAGLVTALLTAAYYTVFRFLEEAGRRIGFAPLRLLAGILLGWARPPAYPARQAVPPVADSAARTV